MPRKKYDLKNRYVKNSNLDESLFLSILNHWCLGTTASKAAKDLPTSKVTIHKYYQALGARALQSFNYRQVCAKKPDLMKKLVAAVGHLLNGTWDYEIERELTAEEMKFQMFESIPHVDYVLKILRPRFRNSYGLDENLIAGYLGYASLIMAAGKASGLDEIKDEDTASDLANKAYELYLDALLETPLDLAASKTFLEEIADI